SLRLILHSVICTGKRRWGAQEKERKKQEENVAAEKKERDGWKNGRKELLATDFSFPLGPSLTD
ncbi:hypothetical protein RUM43_012464, partial [Polyplax serrata]